MNNFLFQTIFVFLISLFFIPYTVGQNNLMVGQISYETIDEPSFESQGNWIFTGPAGTVSVANAPSGSKVLFLRGQAKAEQSINVPADGCYRFDIQGTQAGAAGSNGFRIFIDGMEVVEATPSNVGYSQIFSVGFTLTAGNHDVEIIGTTNTSFAVLLDDIQLANLPCWSDPNNWSQTSVPDINDVALIRDVDVIVLDVNGICSGIKAEGKVLAANNLDLQLDADIIELIGLAALMEWGQENTPYEKNGIITLHGDIASVSASQQGAALMAMMGANLQMHGKEKHAWTQLGSNANQGDFQITLKEAVDWEIGDEFVIASTDFDPHQAETRIISQISGAGTILHFAIALSYNHYGLVESFPNSPVVSELNARAEVGVLTRNLKIRGDADAAIDKIGGHVMIMKNSFAQVSGVEFYQMGQEGILGRYPFHWHLTGDITNQYLKNSSINISFNRVMTIHSSSNGLVENNVAYDHIGNGYFLENGDELNNQFIGNLGILTKAAQIGKEVRVYDRFPTSGGPYFKLPATYWITHPTNDFIGNVSAGSEGSGFWMVVQPEPIEGDNPNGLFPRVSPLGTFDDNVGHSTAFSNFAIDLKVALKVVAPGDTIHVLEESGTYRPPFTPVVNNFTSFKCRDRAFWMRTESFDFEACSLGDNGKSSFFSYHNVIRNSLYVGKSNNIGTPSEWETSEVNAGRSLPFPLRDGQSELNYFKGHPLYDGPSGIENCHFANFYGNNAVIFNPNTAATKSTVHFCKELSFTNVPTANKVGQLFSKDKDFQWTTGLIDLDGSLDALTNPGDVIKPRIFPIENPDRRVYDEGFNVEVGATYIPQWEHYICTEEHYGLLLLENDFPDSRRVPMYSIRSDGPATITEGQDNKNQIPVIVNNENYRYYLQYHRFPDKLVLRLRFLSQNDEATFVVQNIPSNRVISKENGSINFFTSLNNFENSNSEGYYYKDNTLYVRLKGTGLHNVKQFGDEFPYTSNIQICKSQNCGTVDLGGTKEVPLADFGTLVDERASLSTAGNLTVGNIVAVSNGANAFSITSDGDGVDEYIEYRLDFHRQVWSEFNNLNINYSGPKIEVLLHDQSEGEVPLGYYEATSCEGLDLTGLTKAEIDQVDGLLIRVKESSLGDLNQSSLFASVIMDEINLDYSRDLWDYHRTEEDWSAINDATILATDGILDYSQTSISAYMNNQLFSGKAPVNPEDNPSVVIRMKLNNTSATTAKFYHFPWGIGWQDTNFNLINDGQYHNYIVQPNWNNNFDIQRVRLDPLKGGGAGDCEIDFIRFTSCSDCYNEIQDIQNGETGVDCGGPICKPCPCEDGIQNFEETGIDCGGPDCQPCSQLVFENGVIDNLSDNWQTINTSNSYNTMVVIATPELVNINSNPIVTRIRNVSATSFEIMLQSPSNGVVGNHRVHYLVVEAGVYTKAIDGIEMEAWTELSTSTARKNNWVMESRGLINTYSNPAVLGQVQSYNDPLWSVFWASKDGQRNAPPPGGVNNFAAGKHIAEDNQFNRTDEVLGILVIESGLYEINGQLFEAGLGNDIILGVQNGTGIPPIPYTLSNQIEVESAVLSSAAMDGNDGGWPVLFTNNPLQGNRIFAAIDEDVIANAERSHTSEQLAYFAFGSHAINEQELREVKKEQIADRSIRFLIYPNPISVGQSFVLEPKVEAFEKLTNFEIYAIDGRSFPFRMEYKADNRFEVFTDLLPGMYFMTFKINGVRSATKLIITDRL